MRKYKQIVAAPPTECAYTHTHAGRYIPLYVHIHACATLKRLSIRYCPIPLPFRDDISRCIASTLVLHRSETIYTSVYLYRCIVRILYSRYFLSVSVCLPTWRPRDTDGLGVGHPAWLNSRHKGGDGGEGWRTLRTREGKGDR